MKFVIPFPQHLYEGTCRHYFSVLGLIPWGMFDDLRQKPLEWVWPENLPPVSVKHFLKMNIGGHIRRSISGTWKANMKQAWHR